MLELTGKSLFPAILCIYAALKQDMKTFRNHQSRTISYSILDILKKFLSNIFQYITLYDYISRLQPKRMDTFHLLYKQTQID